MTLKYKLITNGMDRLERATKNLKNAVKQYEQAVNHVSFDWKTLPNEKENKAGINNKD